jgi:hypothetical protein
MRGRILFNGNIVLESDFVKMARDWLLSSLHEDRAVRESLKVLLITAGWLENEFEEEPIKAALRDIGIPSRFVGGFDGNLQNLSAYHSYRAFLDREPSLATAWNARAELMEATRRLYLEKNSFYVGQLRRSLGQLKERQSDGTLARVMQDVTGAFSHPPADFDGDRLMGYFLGGDIRDTLGRLIDNDDRMVELLRDLDEHFVVGTGLHFNPTWRGLRQTLEERILSANSIFLFGGNLAALHRCLHFFRLGEVLVEALRRGTSFYTVSAGSLIMCERIIVYNDFATGAEFNLYDRGFGLVRSLQLFPHCMDRIQTDDPDNLSYLAYRFQNRQCVGLNKDSFLLLEDQLATSVGKRDGVYLFDPSGAKMRYDYQQQML